MTFESLQGNEALSRVDGDIGVFSNGGTTHEVSLEFHGEMALLLSEGLLPFSVGCQAD